MNMFKINVLSIYLRSSTTHENFLCMVDFNKKLMFVIVEQIRAFSDYAQSRCIKIYQEVITFDKEVIIHIVLHTVQPITGTA